MTEEQLRDVLARVVPEAPDSVTDPAPVVRAARNRRRAQVALAGGAVALVGIAGVLGGRALVDDDPGPQVADEGSLSGDPYSAAACPEVLPESVPLPDLSEVKAVRYCAAGFNGFPAQPGPPDALLSGMGDLAAAVAAIPAADPARCAAVDVIPSDTRLALQLADGSLTFAPATMCANVETTAATIDGADLAQAFLATLDQQRDAFDYLAGDPQEVACSEAVSLGPVRPDRESLVAASWCTGVEGAAIPFGPDSVALVAAAWAEARMPAESAEETDECRSSDYPYALARTDRGDVVQLSLFHCEGLSFDSWDQGQVHVLPVDVDDLTEN